VRPGERLNEILFTREEAGGETGIAGIVAAKPSHPSLEAMRGWIATLEQALVREEREAIYRVLRDAVPDFRGEVA
jgi:FlaA1/EpsC-like NDP-sugar epimerase